MSTYLYFIHFCTLQDYHAINESEQSKAPHSFVITRGDVGKYVKKLEKDIRKVSNFSFQVPIELWPPPLIFLLKN